MRLIFVLLLFPLCTSSLLAQYETFEQRRDTVIAFFSNNDIGSNYPAATALTLDSASRSVGFRMLENLTSGTSPDIIERFRMTAAYIHLHDILPDSLNLRFQYIWSHFPVRPFDGEHERIAYYSALYLATRYFPEDLNYFNGRSRMENEQDARAYLLRWIKESTELGQKEFDSPTYAGIFLTSMLLLRDFAVDMDMSRRADLMAQWIMADFAHDHLHGSYVGAHAREHMWSAMNPMTSDMTSIAWLYFGDGPMAFGRDQLFVALSSFQVHPAIVELATSRREPFESWERKRSARRIREMTKTDEAVDRYTYMTPLYAIGSIPGGLIQPREQHSWDVTWIAKDPNSPATLFVMHPYSDIASLTPFLPHEGELALRNTDRLDPTFSDVSKSVGGSPFEDVFQYKNTLIAMYDLGDVSRFPIITGVLPPDSEKIHIDSLSSGWITIDAGDVYMGVFPFTLFRLARGQLATRFLSNVKRNGVIVQVMGKKEIGSFKQFQKRLHATKPDLSAYDSDLRVSYTTMTGRKLLCTFGGERTVDGNRHSMSEEMLFESPWLNSVRGSGILTLKASRGTIQIDMQKLEIRTLP